MRRKRAVAITFLLIIIVLGLCGFDTKTTFIGTKGTQLSPCLEATDDELLRINDFGCGFLILDVKNEVLSSQGEIFGIVSYEMPVIYKGQGDGVEQATINSINDYFNADKENFFSSSGVGEVIDKASECAITGRNAIPLFSAKILTEIVSSENSILSIRQLEHWFSGGTNCDYEHGLTFDMTTGKRLLLSDFILLPFEEFVSKLTDFVYISLNADENVCSADFLQEASIYSNYDEYSFFVKGNIVYIIIPAESTAEVDIIVGWSIEQGGPIQLDFGRRLRFDSNGNQYIQVHDSDPVSIE